MLCRSALSFAEEPGRGPEVQGWLFKSRLIKLDWTNTNKYIVENIIIINAGSL